MLFFLLVHSWESFTTPAKDWRMPLDRRWWACRCAGTSKSTKMSSWFLVSNFSVLCDWEMCSWAWKPECECTRLRACCVDSEVASVARRVISKKRNPLLLVQKSRRGADWKQVGGEGRDASSHTSVRRRRAWTWKSLVANIRKDLVQRQIPYLPTPGGFAMLYILGPVSINNSQRTNHDEW